MATNPKDVTRHHYSLEEYFALEDASDARFEYWDGDILCMSGGSRAHHLTSSNVLTSLAVALRGGRCRVFTGDAPIWTPTLPPYRYPDASVVCDEPEYKNKKGHDALVNPAVIGHDLTRLSARLTGRAACNALHAARKWLMDAARRARPGRLART